MPMNRHAFLTSVVAFTLLTLTGCATVGDVGRASLGDALRRLLTLSSRRAFARLLAPGENFADEFMRTDLPTFDVDGALAVLLRSEPVRQRLLRQANRAARDAAAVAAPVVTDAIRTLTFADARSIVRRGPDAATAVLRGAVYDAVVARLLPEVSGALRLFDSAIVAQALRAGTGVDFVAFTRDVSRRTGDAIFRAIAREEAAIRADPRETNDPLLIGVFTLLR